MVLSKINPSRSMLAVMIMAIALGACRAMPEVRPADGSASPADVAEGRRLLTEGRAVEAVTAFRQYLRQHGPDVQGLNGLAIAYGELGKLDLAAEMFGRALALEPDDPATLNNIGFSALRRADSRLARRYLEKAQHGKGTFEEIDGNFSRLALLEMIERTRSADVVLRKAAWHPADHQPEGVIHLSMPVRKHGARPGPPAPNAKPAKPASTLIDFTTVIDPFSPAAIPK